MLATVWVAAVAAGLRFLFHYENTPGAVGALSPVWRESQISLAPDRPTLVMVAHPRCPCTAASMGELAQIMTDLQGKLAAYVLFVKPKNADADWNDTGLQQTAQAIPGVTVLIDAEGAEARRFGAETSGQTFLFGADGKLLFSGGITGSRGHAGENAGESAIVALVNHQTPALRDTMVFGCALAERKELLPQSVCLK